MLTRVTFHQHWETFWSGLCSCVCVSSEWSLTLKNVRCFFLNTKNKLNGGCPMSIREYQDMEFFSRSTSDVYREVHWTPEIPNVKEFFKNIHSLPAGLSFKLTNQVAGFMQSANSSA